MAGRLGYHWKRWCLPIGKEQHSLFVLPELSDGEFFIAEKQAIQKNSRRAR